MNRDWEARESPIDLFNRMVLIRAFEEKNIALAAQGHGNGTCTCVGQEAAAVGVVQALDAHDYILTNHRNAGHLLARGADPARLMAEIMGRSTGYCKGKSGNLHVSVKELGVVLTSTIVGAELSLAPGVALAASLKNEPAVVACFFGDGAACEGIFHESLNLAAVWNLPVLYICENNQWQAFVRRDETMLTGQISDRAQAYGLEGRTVDGNDVEAVYAAALEAVEQVRVTQKPFLLETHTYRLRGHFEPDDLAYVDKEEHARWSARDPIVLTRQRLIASQLASASQVEQLEREAREAVEQAFAFASSSPFPSIEELTTDVYA